MTKDFTNRMYEYTRKSIGQTSIARSYDRLLNTTLTPTKPVSHEHVGSLIRSAQHRIRAGDNYNMQILIGNAVDIVIGV